MTGYRAKTNPFKKSEAIGFRVVISASENEEISDDTLPASSYPTPEQVASSINSSSSGSHSTASPVASSPASSSKDPKLVYVVYTGSNGVTMRNMPSKSGNSMGSLHNQYDVVLKQTSNSNWDGSTEWVQIEATGWMPVKVGSTYYMKKEGNKWRVTWNKYGDNFVSMRSGTSTSNKLVSKVSYGSVVEELETRWVGSKHYIRAKFTGWASRTDGGNTYIVDKIY